MKGEWQITTLDQIPLNLDSKRIPITKTDRVGGEYPYYGASGIVDYVSDYLFDCDTLLVSEDGANLLARSTPIAFPASGKYWVNNHAHVLKFDNFTTQRFIELYFENISLDHFITGAAQPKLTQRALNSIPVPYPPLSEQQRIVTILDEIFIGIAAARANTEQNIDNVRALFKSQFHSAFTKKGDSWTQKSIAQCFKVKSGDFLPAKAMVSTGQFPVYGGNGIAGTHNQKNLSNENIVIGRVGAKCGNVRHVKGELWLTDNAFFISKFFQDFEMGFLAKLLEYKGLRSTANQAAQPVISYMTIKDVLLDFPIDKWEQKTISLKLDEIKRETQRLESVYNQKLEALDELKSSLLHQAFNGQL